MILQEPQPKKAPSGVRFYLRVLGYFRQDGVLIALLTVLIWISLGLGATGPAVIAVLTDDVLANTPHGSNAFTRQVVRLLPAHRTSQVLALAIVWLALQISNDTLTLAREMLNNRLRYNGAARVRHELFDHLQELGPVYHKQRSLGDSIYRLSFDAQGFFGVLNTFVGAANSLLTLTIIGMVMLEWNMEMTAVAVGLTPALILANAYFGVRIRRTSLVSKAADTAFTTFIHRALESLGLVQQYGRQVDESKRFRDAIDQTIRAGMQMNWQEQLHPLAQRIIYALGYAFILAYGGGLVHREYVRGAEHPFTVGGIFAMTFYLGQLWEPLRRITGFTADVQTNATACARVFEVLDEQPSVRDTPGARRLIVRPRTLEMRDVHFRYDGREILRGISVKIEPGAMVGFIGRSGAGKSTILNLLPRFYDPCDGAILLDGQDLRNIRLSDVRQHIAVVPQDSPIVAGTLAENIAFGKPSASVAEIRAAAEMAGADEFIDRLPNAYATELAEGGKNLSGGQRQRLAIARALLSDAPILLLDEPTSSLDRESHLRVTQTLRNLKGMRTIVMVTHQLAAVRDCDDVFLLADGRITRENPQRLSPRALPAPTRDQLFNAR